MHEFSLAGVDLNLLFVLRALLAERHVTRAAAKVGLSQSATSHALARLRDLYDDPLLVRQGRALVPSARASAILPALERALDELQGTFGGAASFVPAEARRAFVLGSPDYGLAVVIAPLLRRLATEAPGIDLHVTTNEPLVARLEQGEIDLAFVVGPRERAGLATLRLFKDDFLCMVRRDHPTVRSRLTLDQYVKLDHLLVSPTGTPGSIVDSRLAERRLTRRVAARVSSFLAVPTLVTATDLVNTGPARLARLWANHHAVRVLPPPIPLPSFEVSLVWHRRHDADPAHAWLRRTIEALGVDA